MSKRWPLNFIPTPPPREKAIDKKLGGFSMARCPQSERGVKCIGSAVIFYPLQPFYPTFTVSNSTFLPCEIYSGQPNYWEHCNSSFDIAWWRTLFARLNIQFQWHLNENPLLSIHNVLTIFICDCPILWQCHSRSGLKNGGIHYFHLHPASLWVHNLVNRLWQSSLFLFIHFKTSIRGHSFPHHPW